MTPYHAKYYARKLSRSGGEGVDRLGRALFDATVELNPHQIEAAMFALRSPLSKGVLLAHEVGLGKTIEAGLTLCQYWAESRRNLLVICSYHYAARMAGGDPAHRLGSRRHG
jgi:SNF2 family DNA or RNA helicase